MCQTLIKYHQTVTHTYKFDILAVMNVCGYLKKKYYARFWFVSIFAALCSSLGGRAKRWWWQQRSSSISDTWRWASFSKLMTFGLILGTLKISHITSEVDYKGKVDIYLESPPDIVLQGDDIPAVLADHRHVAVGTRGLQRLLHLCRNGYHGDEDEASSDNIWREGCPNLLKRVRWCCSDVKKNIQNFIRRSLTSIQFSQLWG